MLLSQASRVTLIKSVLSSIPVYHLNYFSLSDKEARKCDSIVANFFWGNHQNNNTPHMLSWDKICLPKHLGGLGIRKFKDFNSALLGRQAGRIINSPNSILSKIYRAKDCVDENNLLFKATSQPFPLARNICKQINLIVRDCKWRVGNGQSIQVGNNLWFKPLTPNPQIRTVSDLMNASQGWNFNLLNEMFNSNDTRDIMKIHISHTNRPDSIVWTKDTKGSFSVKAAYRDLINTRSLPNPRSNMDWSYIWDSHLPPKLLLFSGKCLHNSLPLGDNLLRKQFKIDGKCPFGCDTVETDTHLFLGCPMTRAAWFGSPLAFKSSMHDSQNFQDWLYHCFMHDQSDDHNILHQILWFCWAIYLHRNEVFFKKTTRSPRTIIED